MLLVVAGTLTLVRFAPGYFAEMGELDSSRADVVRTSLQAQRETDHSVVAMLRAVAHDWLHGNLGISRQYNAPVWQLIAPRLGVTAALLGQSLCFGWISALLLALPLSALPGRKAQVATAVGAALLLGIPIGALATLLLLIGRGGPALALGVVMAARDFKFFHRMLQREWRSPHLVLARAQGVCTNRLVMVHLLRPVLPELLALLVMSFTVALSMVVPAEVIFDVPGLGQLAWNAATNRDAPVLVAVTLLISTAVAFAGSLTLPRTGKDASRTLNAAEPA